MKLVKLILIATIISSIYTLEIQTLDKGTVQFNFENYPITVSNSEDPETFKCLSITMPDVEIIYGTEPYRYDILTLQFMDSKCKHPILAFSAVQSEYTKLFIAIEKEKWQLTFDGPYVHIKQTLESEALADDDKANTISDESIITAIKEYLSVERSFFICDYIEQTQPVPVQWGKTIEDAQHCQKVFAGSKGSLDVLAKKYTDYLIRVGPPKRGQIPSDLNKRLETLLDKVNALETSNAMLRAKLDTINEVDINTLDRGDITFILGSGLYVKGSDEFNTIHLKLARSVYSFKEFPQILLAVDLLYNDKLIDSITTTEEECIQLLKEIAVRKRNLQISDNNIIQIAFGHSVEFDKFISGLKIPVIKEYLPKENTFITCYLVSQMSGLYDEFKFFIYDGRMWLDMTYTASTLRTKLSEAVRDCKGLYSQHSGNPLDGFVDDFIDFANDMDLQPVETHLNERLIQLTDLPFSTVARTNILAKINKTNKSAKRTVVEDVDASLSKFTTETVGRKGLKKLLHFNVDKKNNPTVMINNEYLPFDCFKILKPFSKYLYSNTDINQPIKEVRHLQLLNNGCKDPVIRLTFSDFNGFLGFVDQYKAFAKKKKNNVVKLKSKSSFGDKSKKEAVKALADSLYKEFITKELEYHALLKMLLTCDYVAKQAQRLNEIARLMNNSDIVKGNFVTEIARQFSKLLQPKKKTCEGFKPMLENAITVYAEGYVKTDNLNEGYIGFEKRYKRIARNAKRYIGQDNVSNETETFLGQNLQRVAELFA
jgi:hypothetical protein